MAEKNFSKAIIKARTLSELDYIEEKLKKTSQINRRTKAGRELSKELLGKLQDKGRELINLGEQPF